MRRMAFLVALVGLMVLPVMLAPRAASAAAGAQIVNAVYGSGFYYSGQGVTSTVQVKNTGTAANTLWIRHSVRDNAGKTYNVAVFAVTLNPGQTSAAINRTWTVPDPADPSTLTTGFYKSSFAVYDSNPDTTPTAPRLSYNEKPNAFRAHNFIDQFSTFDSTRWAKSDKGLGFVREQGAGEAGCGAIGSATNVLYTTHLNPSNVALSGAGQLQTKMPAGPAGNACAEVEGGEIRSLDSYEYGTYEVSMQVPDAPSSITGFFLYGGDGIAEIDIETFNEKTTDPATGANRGKVMFTTYAKNADGSPNPTPTHTTNGEPGNEPPQTLPFDPTAGMHTYRFDFYPGSIKFYADGTLMKEWTDGLPSDNMRLFLNTWYPKWMSRTPPPEDRYLNVDWIRH